MDLRKSKWSLFPRHVHKLLGCLGMLAMLLPGVGCKRTDKEPPSIEILQPAANFSGVGSRRVRLEGRVTDNEGVTSVVAQLSSSLNGLVVASEAAILDGNEWRLDLVLGDRYTPTGSYLLQVLASDAAGLSSSDFRTVALTELPLEWYGLWIAGEGSGNSYQIHYLDSLEQVRFKGSYGATLSSMHADNDDQSLLLAESTGRLGSYNDDLSPRYETQLNPGSSGSLQAFYPYRKNHYAGLETPPYARVYTPDGAFKSNVSGAFHGVNAVARSTESLFMGGVAASAPPFSFVISKFDARTNSLEAQLNPSFAPVGLSYAIENECLYALGSATGNGELLRIQTTPGWSVQEAVSFGEQARALATSANAVFVLGSNGLYRLGLANWALPSLIYPGNFYSLAYDPSRQRIYLGGDGQVDELNENGLLINSFVGNWGLTRHLSGHFNK